MKLRPMITAVTLVALSLVANASFAYDPNARAE
jgi:hypothetical protein